MMLLKNNKSKINYTKAQSHRDVLARKIQELEKMKKHAEAKGGKCLSREYTNCTAKYLWECSKGHQWEATWAQLKHKGTWCRECFKLTIEEMRDIATKRGG